MDYQGIIIQESLMDFSILKELEMMDTKIEKVTETSETPWLKKWTMHTVRIKENEIEKYTKILSNSMEKEHCENWYCDFKNDKFHYFVFDNKIFKLERTNQKDYQQMIKYAISIGLPEYQLPKFNEI